jgi:DNA-binding beta-propeller fold protein YncE
VIGCDGGMKTPPLRSLAASLLALTFLLSLSVARAAPAAQTGRFLYAAAPGIRDYLEFGGHGVLVFDIDHGHRFVKRIKSSGVDAAGKPLNVKGICASAATRRLYVSTTQSLICFDLTTDQILWEKSYDGGCDRMSITPDGKTLYVPTFEKESWHVVDGATGAVLATITPKSNAHNTIVGPDGREAYLAGLKSPLLTVADTRTMAAARTVGPFSNAIRPFTINGRQTRVYVNVNELLGFEIGDLKTGQMLARVEVKGFELGPTKRHGCPSHGIALTRDEREVWICDAHNSRIHIFDNTVMPPKQVATIGPLREQPGWLTFSIDGSLVYASTGEVIDPKTRKIVATLTDEHGAAVHSEKVVEVDFANGVPVRAGDQFAIGGVR